MGGQSSAHAHFSECHVSAVCVWTHSLLAPCPKTLLLSKKYWGIVVGQHRCQSIHRARQSIIRYVVVYTEMKVTLCLWCRVS